VAEGRTWRFFDFFPAFNPKIAWSYQVPCVAEDFLRFTLLETLEAYAKDADTVGEVGWTSIQPHFSRSCTDKSLKKTVFGQARGRSFSTI
jgi:hypothetical protein